MDMALSLFKPVQFLTERTVHHQGIWWIWSDSVRNTLDRISAVLPGMPSPTLIHLLRGEDYEYTYTLSLKEHLPPELEPVNTI